MIEVTYRRKVWAFGIAQPFVKRKFPHSYASHAPSIERKNKSPSITIPIHLQDSSVGAALLIDESLLPVDDHMEAETKKIVIVVFFSGI